MNFAKDAMEDDGGGINLTPLIDIVFLLLIFFMVTSSFQDEERDIAVTVPEAESGDRTTDLPSLLVIAVREDGAFLVQGQQLGEDQLRRLLKRAKRSNPDQRALLRADRLTRMQATVTVLGLCKALGVPCSLAVSTEKVG